MATAPEPALVDTNVLVYALFPAVTDHAASRALLDTANAPDCSAQPQSPPVLAETPPFCHRQRLGGKMAPGTGRAVVLFPPPLSHPRRQSCSRAE